MDEALRALKHLGITTNIILIIVLIVAIAYLYKSVLETQKLRLEISKLNRDLTQQQA